MFDDEEALKISGRSSTISNEIIGSKLTDHPEQRKDRWPFTWQRKRDKRRSRKKEVTKKTEEWQRMWGSDCRG